MLTKREAAIITAYTGIRIGDFNEFHKYIEEKLQRPILSHELANKDVWDKLKILCKEDFINIPIE